MIMTKRSNRKVINLTSRSLVKKTFLQAASRLKQLNETMKIFTDSKFNRTLNYTKKHIVRIFELILLFLKYIF